MWYTCVPVKNKNRNKNFIGYTDNYAYYHTYIKFLMTYGYEIPDVYGPNDGINTDCEEDFICEVSSILNEPILYDNELRMIPSMVSNDHLIVPDKMYERFTSYMYTSTKPRNLLIGYLRLTGNSTQHLISYLRNTKESCQLMEYIKLLQKTIDILTPYDKISLRTLLAHKEGVARDTPLIYQILDEYALLKEYVVSKLVVFPNYTSDMDDMDDIY